MPANDPTTGRPMPGLSQVLPGGKHLVKVDGRTALELKNLAAGVLIGLKCLEQDARKGDQEAAAYLREFRQLLGSELLRLGG